ncbi:MAG: SURF1 family protein [Panacagrimonas sp.]
MSYRFRPPLWSIPPTVLVTALFVTLGIWQSNRGQAKQVLEDAFGTAADGEPLRLTLDTPTPDSLSTARAQISGSYDTARQLLLDNQTRERVPGYHVWTPMQLGDGWLIVNRGWIAADPDRRVLPSVEVSANARAVTGYWRPLPKPGFKLATDPCEADDFPRVASYPTREQLACVLGAPVAAGVLLLDPSETDGYVREWNLPNPVPPARHYAYAAQWFAFAATLLFLFVKLNLKRT